MLAGQQVWVMRQSDVPHCSIAVVHAIAGGWIDAQSRMHTCN
jgi:hypothetical protein